MRALRRARTPSIRRRPMQRAELVAVGVAQISEVQFAEAALADAGRVLDRGAAILRPGLVPGIRLVGAAHREADRGAVPVGGGATIDWRRDHEDAAIVEIDQAALVVLDRGLAAHRAEQGIVESL